MKLQKNNMPNKRVKYYPGSEVPKPNLGAPNLKSRPQDERMKRAFFAFFVGEPLIQGSQISD